MGFTLHQHLKNTAHDREVWLQRQTLSLETDDGVQFILRIRN